MEPEALTVPGLVEHRAAATPHLEALVTDDEVLTYAGLEAASRDVAGRLVAAGVGRGHRVGLLMPNRPEWAATAYGVLRAGATLVPLSTLLRPPELAEQLEAAAVTELITVEGHRGRRYLDDLEAIAPGVTRRRPPERGPALPALRVVWPSGALPSDRAPDDVVTAIAASVRPADDMAIMFTSGSRGAPKAVVHTHGNAVRAIASSLEARRVTAGERLYMPMPFFWMGGFGTGLLSVLVAGATLLVDEGNDAAASLAFLARHRATVFRGWPDQAARIAADPAFATTDLSHLGPGSLPAILPPGRRPAPGTRPNIFGMTETFGPWCGDRLDLDLPAGKEGSCGRPFEGVELRVVDVTTREPVGAGATGELLLRGPNLMRGLFGRERGEVFDDDGWFATGDLGRVDPDGYVSYEGRADDMFKVSGATVYPSEVETALRSVPGVVAAHATDVRDAEGRARVGALVVVGDPEVSAHLRAGARERLSSFKVPEVWLVTDDPQAVPLLATGKVDKPALQGLLAERGAPAPG